MLCLHYQIMQRARKNPLRLGHPLKFSWGCVLVFIFLICTDFIRLPNAFADENLSDFQLNQLSSTEFTQTYAFLIGQTETARRIEELFPNYLTAEKMKFASAFPGLFAKLDAVAAVNFDFEKFEEFKANGLKAVAEHFQSIRLDEAYAKSFKNELSDRAKGNIPTPILETILSIQFHTNPVTEFFAGYKNKFSSLNHGKAKGVEVEFEVPKSFKRKDGKRPNILSQWTSRNGWGYDIVNIGIYNLDREYELGEIRAYQANDVQLAQQLSDGFTLKSSRLSMIEDQPYVQIESVGTLERAGMKLTSHNIYTQIFYKDKLLGLTCMSPENRRSQMSALCEQILNSIVLPEKY